MTDLVVGFDLDMTLIDSRPGIAATWDAIAAETGVPVDSALAVSRLGPPLAHEAAQWFPADQVDRVVERYRALYPSLAIARSRPLPGAMRSFQAVRDRGGTILVVTSKLGRLAQLHIDHASRHHASRHHAGLKPDVVVGDVFAEEKGAVLAEYGASVYVGDHLGDVRAAKAAHAVSVAVATGPISAEDLAAAGADVVLPDLTGFPEWLDRHLT